MREKNKGITLIALIITIIIMLILVGITIQVVINSNLFEIAQDAGNRTETAYQEESAMGGVTINGKDYESMDEYLNGPAPQLAYTVKRNIITVSLADSFENYVAKKSIPEKEQALAEINYFSDINALIREYYAGSREDYETDAMELFGGSTYEEALNFACSNFFEEEYVTAYGDLIETVVTVTDPSGAEHELYYAPITAEAETSFTYSVNDNGNYKFTAVNNQGRTAELTVPIEGLEFGTFTLKCNEWDFAKEDWSYVVIGTYDFVKGDHWDDLQGCLLEEDFMILCDEGKVYVMDNGWDNELWTDMSADTSKQCVSTDEIVDGGIYTVFYEPN